MKLSTISKKLMSILLVLALLVSSVVSGNAVFAEEENENESTGLSWEVVENDKQRAADKLKKLENTPEEDALNLKGDVRVSIVLEGGSTLDQGYSAKGVAENPSAVAYRDSLKQQQDNMAAAISREVLGGEKLDVVWNLTLAANIISANVPADKIYAIRDLQGVKDVVVETQYYPEATFANPDDPNMTVATGMTTVNSAWAAGYSGAGSKVAIVDTGLDLDHQSFNPTALEYSLEQNELKYGTEYTLMSKKDVQRLWESLNASQYGGSAEDAYRNTKVPYAFNYVDADYDVSHLNDIQGEHGSHVAGIATANKYVYLGGESGNSALADSFTTAKTIGNAPDAQVLVMKVFGKGGGAFDSDYFSAIEDAIVLGADSVNLSLGSSSAGFARNSTYQEIIDSLVDVNIVWANSAGNNSYWSEQTPYSGYLYAGAGTFATGGSPATYANTLSTASVDNDGFTGAYLIYNGEWIFYTETSGYGNEKMTTAAGTYEYVYIDGPGVDDNSHVGMEGDTFLALGEDVIKGKIAICNRGSSSFFAKANAAAAQGAAAVIIGNNVAGTISMNLKDYAYTVPVVSITQADATTIKASSQSVTTEAGIKYYTGTITISEDIDVTHYDQDYYKMSNFSSYGVPGDLSMKPEITAPGGNIYSVFGMNLNSAGDYVGGHDAYENMSGTSMASPQIAGIVAVLAQYVRENGLDEKAEELGITRRALIQSLLMSTATPLINEESGDFYSIMNQGSGLANVEAAINSNIVVLMNDTKVNGENRKDISSYAKDGKVKAELGDDPDRSGKYSVEFTLNNISDHGLSYDLDGYFFTQDLYYFLLDTWTVGLNPSIAWYVDGVRFVSDIEFDFNGDGTYDEQDAQAILDYVAGLRDSLNDIDYADFDGDGEITTRDAYEALKVSNQGAAYIPANSSITVRAEIDLSRELPYCDANGAYVEGYLFAAERDSKDGAIGVVHSIPVLGYYGNWSEPSMIDIGSYVKYDYEMENYPPYMYVDSALGKNALAAQALVGYSKDLNANYVLEGNPLGAYYDDYTFYPERNAFNSNNTIVGAQYTLIRNARAYQYKLINEKGETVKENGAIGNMYAAYYYPADAEWKNTLTSMAFNLTPSSLKEGDAAELQFYLAPEYYVSNGEVDWDNVPATWVYEFVVDNSAPEITTITGERVVEEASQTEEGEEIPATDTIKLSIKVSDNEYIAGLFVYEEGDALVYEKGSRADEKTEERDNQNYEIELDGSEISDHLYVEVWDYAGNLTTVQINLNKDELQEPIGISLDEEYVRTVVNSPYKLNAKVTPWGSDDMGVIWSSSDESVAVVSESGVVTGIEAGYAVITATAHADPEKSASCEFEFVKIDRTLKGFVWDEQGQVWFSEFNTSSLPDYEKLSGSLKLPLASATYAEDGLLYAASLDTTNLLSSIYVVDENTFEAEMLGSNNEIAFMDLCPAPSLGEDKLLGVYGPYVVVLNRYSGDYEGFFDMSSYTSEHNLVGIAYEEQYDHPSYGYTDWVWFIDETGTLYQTGFLPYGESYSRFKVSTVGNVGYSTDTFYFQSLYYDGTDLYWSRYVEASNKVDIIYIADIYNDGTVYNLGSFADSVWPVGGILNDNLKEMIGIESNRHADAQIDPEAVFETEIEPISLNSSVHKGVANSFNGIGSTQMFSKEDVKTVVKENEDSDSTRTVIDLVADADGTTNNGLYEVSYDPEIMEFVYVVTKLPYYAVNDKEAGKVVFAFADLDGIAADEVIAKVEFERIGDGRTVVSVAEKETNNDIDHDAKAEEIEFKNPSDDFGDILPEDQPGTEAEIPEGIWLSRLVDMEYTGQALTQDFRVYHHKKLLTKGIDYTVAYKNNTKAGEATVTVTGKGNYKDKVSKTFTIYPAAFNEDNTVIILNKDAFVYNGKNQKAVVNSVMYKGKKLTKQNYTVAYENEGSVEKGVYKITVTGKGNYSGEMAVTYQISEGTPVSTLSISGIVKKVYTGEKITQGVTVKDGKNILTEGVDYKLNYKDNVHAGTAYVTVTGLGNYIGSVTKTFTIAGLKLAGNNTTVSGLPDAVPYCGEYEPEITVNYGETVLVEGKDYTVTFKNNNKVGTATVVIKGIGDYSGSFSKTFKITKISLDDVKVSDVKEQVYQKGGSKPDVELYDPFNDVVLVKGKDYNLSYRNNSKIGTAKVTVSGKGNYAGQLVKEFEVKMADISVHDAKAADKAYANRKNNFKTKLTITDTNGNNLAMGTDYDKNIVYTYVNNTVIDGNTTRQAGEEVGANDIIPAGTELKVTAAGKGNYTGEVSAVYRIVKADIAGAKVNVASQIYTGKEIALDKAEITVKVNGAALNPEDFEIVSYKNNVNKGNASVTIRGVGNYGGTKTVNFKIVQKSFLNAIWTLFN